MNLAGIRHILNYMLALVFYFYVAKAYESENDFIYILSWQRFDEFDGTTGRQYFVNNNCRFQNCFYTHNRSFFNDILSFDVILFNIVEVFFRTEFSSWPRDRSPEQIYIFASSEPSTNFPGLPAYDGFFNYTLTYKLDSDVLWSFFVVRNKTDSKIIAPSRKDVKWVDVNYMEPISEEIKEKLQSKNQAAAWLVSHCSTSSNREDLVTELLTELERYNLRISIIGRGPCIRSYQMFHTPCSYWNKPDGSYSPEICHEWISANHYFYLAFENAMCEDYVTEKILTATKNFAIPIVFGGADYTKFLPTGSYINANDVEPKDLASMMNDLINDKNKYYEYFKWHKYYSIHEPNQNADTNSFCALCALLNEKKYKAISSVYTRFTWYFKS